MADSRTVEMRKSVEEAWLVAIENSGARGKFKKALRAYADKDVGDVMEGLEDADADTWDHWRGYAEMWAASEVQRIHAELTSLDHMVRKEAWRIARAEARRHKRKRTRGLLQAVRDYAVSKGGALPFSPRRIAVALSGRLNKVSPGKVRWAMNSLVAAREAKEVKSKEGSRFVLFEAPTLYKDNQLPH